MTMTYCPTCGAALPAGAAEQPCPACLMRLGLESWVGKTNEEQPTAAYPSKFEAPTIEELTPYLPQFELLELIGQGGMGAVYKARQKSLDRMVAVKIINPHAAGQPGFAERFAREARAMARMNHANIVTIHDFGSVEAPLLTTESAGTNSGADAVSPATSQLYFLVMEYVEGSNVRAVLREKRLQPSEALAIIPPLCDALQYAHEEGIVHRDIKPENILIDRKGRVKIADFGLAKLLGQGPRDVTLTEAFQALGTMHYMAPEQFERPLEVDHRADIYALGVTFYEMLTGELPIGRFLPPSQKVAVDVRLDEVVLRALEREPERRYQQASDVKTAVESCVGTPAREPAVAASVPAVPWRLKLPASGLIVYGTLTLLIDCMFVLGTLVQWEEKGLDVAFGSTLDLGPLLLTGMILSFPVGILAILAGMRMQEYRSRGLGMVASILAMITFTPLIFLGLPIGIWAFAALNASVIRSGFAQAKQARGETLQRASSIHQSPAVFIPGAGPRMLALALGFVTSSLVAAMGIVMLAYGLANYPPGEGPWGGFVGGGFGALVGGIGGVLGTWNNLRKSQGRLDLMHEPHWNWFDTLILLYAVFGIAILVSGALWWSSLDFGLKSAAVGIGGIGSLQGLAFAAWRLATRRAAARTSAEPTLDLRMIVVAASMTMSALIATSGIALLIVALINLPLGSPAFWGWVGAAAGCLLGGVGGLLGTWNTYRSLEGLPDWIAEGNRNAFDRWMAAIGGIGAVLMLIGLVASPWITRTSAYALELLGGILVFQLAIFLPIRALLRRAARQEAEQAES